MNMENTGRLTLPTDVDMVDETIRLKNLLGADALRDCDGTTMPEELLNQNAKIYATYYTTRKDNNWAMQHPEEIQQEYLISDRVTAKGESLRIRLMKGFHTEQLKVNTIDSPKRWWEVVDRTTGEVDFGEGKSRIYAQGEHYQILDMDGKYSRLVVNEYGKGRSVYFTGLPYSPQNCRILLRAIYYAAHREDEMKKYYVTNVDTELAVFEQTGKIAVINNSKKPQKTDLYVNGALFRQLDLAPMEMQWIEGGLI